MSEDAEKFKRYCQQLEKYGQTETVHSPVMALLRRKARKQLLSLMKQDIDCSSSINKLWIVGYYHPFQFFIREDDNSMETVTLLTMFCGELQEMLFFTTKNEYSALWNLFIADLHRYMPDGEIQKLLAPGFYSRAIELDSRHGRAFHMLSVTMNGADYATKLKLMVLSQLAEIPQKKSSDLNDFLGKADGDKFLTEFCNWALNENPKRVDHQLAGLKLINQFKTEVESEKDWPMILGVCRLVAKLAYKKFGYNQFLDCFDVISSFYLEYYSKSETTKSLLSEVILWICDAGEVFGSENLVKKEPYFLSLSVFAKAKWNELNDLVMDHINSLFASEHLLEDSSTPIPMINSSEPSIQILSQLVHNLLRIGHPTMELLKQKGQPLLRRINQTESKRMDIPIEALAEKISDLSNREDWRPVYVLMDTDTILNKTRFAHKIWDIDDFICILPSNVLDELDNQKMRNKAVRPVIRSLMELQAEGRIILKKCTDERHCAEQLVQSAKGSSEDHKNIVAFLCKKPEEEEPMEGVTFYEIKQFYTKYLE
ncbi:hypothetical protein GCK72_001048 [Caenorhabditis remanei]|uniref:PIN domain-containing protein n=1 Tax=Caenorhabditis remanei TaxID=31234 RepID=A0A6A5HSP6_CAERE|nr:hypothetical protein GCK72_001048 [Caenorhabditis remanei]KAF1769233.1 hypothetical protein GCK72_001048 [Caenorhabditis remanei]